MLQLGNLFCFKNYILLDAGPPEEDERYELMIQHTNRVYRVTLDGLIPCEECWGNPVKYHILQSDQVCL